MTTSKLVFDPFCRYDDPCETYRRMRDEAPGYCRDSTTSARRVATRAWGERSIVPRECRCDGSVSGI